MSTIISLILCILLVFSFYPQKTSAISYSDDVSPAIAPVVVGAAISSEAIATLVGATCIAAGAYLYENVDSVDIQVISQGLINTGKVAKDFAIKINSLGKKVLTLTSDGVKDLSYLFKSTLENKLIPQYQSITYDNTYPNYNNFLYSVNFDDMFSFAKSHKVLKEEFLYRKISLNNYENFSYTVVPFFILKDGKTAIGVYRFNSSQVKDISIWTVYNGSFSLFVDSYSYVIYKHFYDGTISKATSSALNNTNDLECRFFVQSDSSIPNEFSSTSGIGLNGQGLLSMSNSGIDKVLPVDSSSSTYIPTIELPISPKNYEPKPDNPDDKPKVFYVPSIDFPYETTIENVPEIKPVIPYKVPVINPSTLEILNPSDNSVPDSDSNVSYVVNPDTNDFIDSQTGTVVDPSTVGKPDSSSKPEPNPEPNPKPNPDIDLNVPDSSVPTLNFEPLKVVTKKFPFSIPWDVWECFKVFEGDSKPLKYKFSQIDYGTGENSIVVIPEFTIDFADYPKIVTLVTLFKYLLLLTFIFMLIRNTRTNFIRG